MLSLSLGTPLHSISLSPNQTEAIVGGRDVIKVVQVDASSPPVESKTLKVASKNDVKFSIVNVEWSQAPGSKHLAAAALNNGAVAIWDLAVQSSPIAKQVKGWFDGHSEVHPHAYQSEKLLTGHQRALNGVTWHPHAGDILLSCSMDNTIRLWDKRRGLGRYCATTFRTKGGFIREVKFSPHFEYRFAAVSDDGLLQIWDQRMQRKPELKLQAHSLPVKTVAWHPVYPWIVATASSDRSIKVHDLNSSTLFWDGRPQPQFKDVLSTLYLPSPVSRIKWRPGRNSHIAACCDSGACTSSVFLYDTSEPYIPLAVLEGHEDVCTGFEWFNPSILESGLDVERGSVDSTTEQDVDSNERFHILACGKDGRVQVMSVHDAMRPHEDIPPCIVTTHPARGITSVNYSFDKSRDRVTVQELTKSKTVNNNMAMPVSTGMNSSFEDNNNSTSTTQPVSNPTSARSINEFMANASDQRNVLTMWSLIYPGGGHVQQSPCIDGPKIDQITGYDPTVIEFLARRYKLRGAPVSHLCTVNAEAAMECGKFEMARMWKILNILTMSAAMSTLSSYYSLEDHSQSVSSTMGNTLGFLSSPTIAPPPNSTIVPQSNGSSPQLVIDVDPLETHSNAQSSTWNFYPMRASQSYNSGVGVQESSHHGTGEGVRSILRGIVSDLVERCIHSGDVQHCVALCEVLRTWEAEVGTGMFAEVEDFGIDKLRLQEIFAAYIDILHRLKLWNCATDLITSNDDVAVAELNQKGTSVTSACGACGTTCNLSSRCSKCAAIVSECSLCRQPVNGLFVWCPGCSHGGHLNHVHAWFSTHDVCPTGCGHKCNFSFFPEYEATLYT